MAKAHGRQSQPRPAREPAGWGLERYYNPYQQQVIDTTLASSDAADGRTRAQQTLDIARNQKFGGSGSRSRVR
jgi:hypothetical protein